MLPGFPPDCRPMYAGPHSEFGSRRWRIQLAEGLASNDAQLGTRCRTLANHVVRNCARITGCLGASGCTLILVLQFAFVLRLRLRVCLRLRRRLPFSLLSSVRSRLVLLCSVLLASERKQMLMKKPDATPGALERRARRRCTVAIRGTRLPNISSRRARKLASSTLPSTTSMR